MVVQLHTPRNGSFRSLLQLHTCQTDLFVAHIPSFRRVELSHTERNLVIGTLGLAESPVSGVLFSKPVKQY